MASFTLKYHDVLLYFGPNAVKEHIAGHLRSGKRALIITSRSAARASGALDHVVTALRGSDIEYIIYDGVRPNPPASTADEAAEAGRSFSADIVIAIGGGSVIDVAKVTSKLIEGSIKASEVVLNPRLAERLSQKPLISINLTHGTGTEVDRYAVLTLDGTIEKRGFAIRYPDVSFDDPTYLVTLNKEQTLFTSLDAFYHSYESATSRYSTLLTETLAADAIERTATYLPRALEELGNLAAREQLLYASMLAGISIDKSMTHLAHAIEHAFSGINPNLPHGAGLAIIGPHVAYYTHKAVPELSAKVLRKISADIRPLSEDAPKARKVVEDFQKGLGFEKRLSDYGILKDDINRAREFIMGMLEKRYTSTPFKPTEEVLNDILMSSL